MPPAPQTWHALAPEVALARLGVDPRLGLSHEEAAARARRHGPNAITVRRGRGPLVRFALQLHAPLVYVLLAAALAAALLRAWVDTAVILAVVVVNAVIGFVQESKALQAIDALGRRMAHAAVALRDGRERRLPAEALVPGDIVLLQSGDRVPADLRLLSARELRTDESALTGESVPVDKHPAPVAPDATLGDRANMAYASTFVAQGKGRGVVVATGDRTELGRISGMLASVAPLATPLTRKIARFSQVLLVAILALAALGFGLGSARGAPTADLLMACVALAVGAIPEGLPAAVTVILAIGVTRLARRNALVRRLPAVETLGSTTVICTDKTGTLTQNQMTVKAVVTQDGAWDVGGVGYAPIGAFSPRAGAPPPERSIALRACVRGAFLCNDAKLTRTENGWTIEGDPTEAALVVAARKLGVDAPLARADTVPFESQHQYMATLHHEGGAGVAYVKGSVERLLPRCADALDAAGARVPLDARAVERAAEALAARALRVLAVARVHLPPGTTTLAREAVESGLTFLGLAGMIDPPRPEAIAAVRACRSAGVKVLMITGDHAATAAAVAREIGIGDGRPVVVGGRALDAISDAELAARASGVDVFARVAPEHKLRIVRALQAAGHVVAMTGDGVNDAPALEQADIGVAMGRAGTDVAREAAAMVLTDDDFASIAAAVEEGRGVFDNLTKFIVWTIPTNLGEGLVVLAALALAVPLPILPLQILWINMTTAVLLGMTLAVEPKEADVMARPPRAPKRPLLTPELLQRTGLVGFILLGGAFGLHAHELDRGATLAEARTVATNVFVVVMMFYLLNCRSLLRSAFALGFTSNPTVLGGIAAMLALQALFTYAPFMNRLFDSAPIGPAAWLRIAVVGLFGFAVVGLEKALRRRRRAARRWGASPRLPHSP